MEGDDDDDEEDEEDLYSSIVSNVSTLSWNLSSLYTLRVAASQDDDFLAPTQSTRFNLHLKPWFWQY